MIRDDRQKDGSQEGAALIGTVMVMLILSMLGTVSMNLAALEIESVGAARDEAVARHLAEAGADLAVQWFHDPQSAPIGTDGSLLGKRYELRHSGPSFFDAQGVSQFVGTADHPDLVYEASKPLDDRLLNDPASGWFRSLGSLGVSSSSKLTGRLDPACCARSRSRLERRAGPVAGWAGRADYHGPSRSNSGLERSHRFEREFRSERAECLTRREVRCRSGCIGET